MSYEDRSYVDQDADRIYEEMVAARNARVFNIRQLARLCRTHGANVDEFLAEHGSPGQTSWTGSELYGWLGY